MKHHILSLKLYTILTILGIGCVSGNISAQEVNSLYFLENTPLHTQWNPAMAPKNSSFGFGLSNISLSLRSDLAFSDLFIPSADGKELYTFLNPAVDKDAFISKLKDISSLNFNSNIDLLNLGIRVLNNYFTFHSGINVDVGAGLPKDLFKMFLLGMDNNAASTTFDLTKTNVNAMAYAKIGVGYSINLGKKFSAGINANYLYGIADLRMGFDQLTVNASQNDWIVTSKGYIQMAAPQQVGFDYNSDGYLNNIKFDSNSENNSSNNSRNLLSSLPHQAGSGLSLDLGITARPLPFLKLSAALDDLGSIKWKQNCVQRAKSNGTFNFNGVDLNDQNSESTTADDVVNSFNDMAHFEKDNSVNAYSSKLTTKLNIGAEAGILNNHISLGVLSQTGFATDGTYQNVMLSANLKPSSIIQVALTYSLLHGKQTAIGAALNAKLLFFNVFLAADCIPKKFSPQYIPVDNSYLNTQFGFNIMF